MDQPILQLSGPAQGKLIEQEAQLTATAETVRDADTAAQSII